MVLRRLNTNESKYRCCKDKAMCLYQWSPCIWHGKTCTIRFCVAVSCVQCFARSFFLVEGSLSVMQRSSFLCFSFILILILILILNLFSFLSCRWVSIMHTNEQHVCTQAAKRGPGISRRNGRFNGRLNSRNSTNPPQCVGDFIETRCSMVPHVGSKIKSISSSSIRISFLYKFNHFPNQRSHFQNTTTVKETKGTNDSCE